MHGVPRIVVNVLRILFQAGFLFLDLFILGTGDFIATAQVTMVSVGILSSSIRLQENERKQYFGLKARHHLEMIQLKI